MNDLIGQALLDYQNNHYTDDLYTETNISEIDVLPLPYLFRSFDAMPPLEQLALKTAGICTRVSSNLNYICVTLLALMFQLSLYNSIKI